ncbi:DNA-binding transcriptional regulator, PadR family [Pedococcus dokdonensis]|uniref:DNA-binding transcriptional regulator, PadR family n=1 Tax=Pedococcus dokdonensis TaxID=443156 RepID=A0A1H0UUK9_9MICO|nr:PadR family transcriptional regulator [Pedococcus dokdonensis]SDP69902.1 DNA-binding transcriptional regulator, PadR family [Pedococcus dokdonensis]
MAATETRLLLLGTVMLFEPVNGYQLRRELLSWEVDDWAHVNPGSIYSGLATLAKQGNLDRHDLVDGNREVAVYTSTPAGRREFARLWQEAVETPDLLSPLPFHTAMALMPLISRTAVREALRTRLANLDARTREQLAREIPPEAVPPHVRTLADLWMGMGQTEREWLVNLIAQVDRGEFGLSGEPADWTAPADDPGWQMANDRQRYVELIARQH